jgi:hypothetical protein
MVRAGIDLDSNTKGFAVIDNITKRVVYFAADDGKVGSFKDISDFDVSWHKGPTETRKLIKIDFCKFKEGKIN